MQTLTEKQKSVRRDAIKLADFIMFTQRSLLLDQSRELNRGNVSYAQFFLLGYLAKEDYLTMTDVSRKMGHSTAAAMGLIDRLEKLGYVQRLHASDDRRKVMVRITRKGTDFVEKMYQEMVDSLVELMEDLDGDEKPPVFEGRIVFSPEHTESELVREVNRGLSEEFWVEYSDLAGKRDREELDQRGQQRIVAMSDEIEAANVERMKNVMSLSKIRGVPVDALLAEFELDAASRS